MPSKQQVAIEQLKGKVTKTGVVFDQSLAELSEEITILNKKINNVESLIIPLQNNLKSIKSIGNKAYTFAVQSLAAESYVATPYKNGEDGDITIDSDVTLTSDIYCQNLTIDSGFVLSPDGYRIYVQDTLTNNGTIRYNAISSTALTTNNIGGSGAGGSLANGKGGAGGGGIVIAALHFINHGTIQANGKNGYNGTAGGQAHGGAGGSTNPSKGGSGGAGGDSNVWANGGAGGVADATVCFLTYSNLIFGQYDLTAVKGGAGGGAGGRDSSGGGGGGGGGGFIGIVYTTYVNDGTIEVQPGTGGSGSGSADAGSTGSVGNIVLIEFPID